ncbi:hypothetical protein [Shewanella scandinavica]|uniref:hypothetical protein n=1 Tax=Shewanella scandinavica TaxID=3063538 RepID=UPI0031918DBF
MNISSSNVKKVALLGGSNSLKKGGIKDGLKLNFEVLNFSLGGSTSLQNLYELIRHDEVIRSCDLVITESNVNEFHSLNLLSCPLSIIEKNIHMYYERLSTLDVPVLILLLPLQTKRFNNGEDINKLHKKYIYKYGFNFIDLNEIYSSNGINDKYYFDNLDHPPSIIMYMLGSIVDIDWLQIHKINNSESFEYLIYNDFEELESKVKSNSMFSETVHHLDRELRFSDNVSGYSLVGFHSWSDRNSILNVSNETENICKRVNTECQFHEILKPINVEMTTVFDSVEFSKSLNFENSIRTEDIKKFECKLDIISFFLVKDRGNKILYEKNSHKSNCSLDLSSKVSFIKDLDTAIDEFYCMKVNSELNKSIIKKLAWRASNIFSMRFK